MPMPPPPTLGAPPPPPPTLGAPPDGGLVVGVLGTDTLGVEGTLGAVTLGVEGTLGTVTLGTEGTSGTVTLGTEGALGAVIVGRMSITVPGDTTGSTSGERVSWTEDPIDGVGELRTLGGLRTLVLPVVARGATLAPPVPPRFTAALSRRS
jgi:hypothetical protein